MREHFKLIAIFCLTLLATNGIASAENEKINLKEQVTKFNDLLTLVRDYLPQNYTRSNFTLEQAKELLIKKCQNAFLLRMGKTQLQMQQDDKEEHVTNNFTNTETIKNMLSITNKLIKCPNIMSDLPFLLSEIEAARPHGELDSVFEKYCVKMPQAKECLEEFNELLLPCLTPAERIQNTKTINILKQLMHFMCYRNGDIIALFIAEGGPECLESSKSDIADCVNATVIEYLPSPDQLPPLELPELVLGPQQCLDFYDFERCIVSSLEKCDEISPAGIIESFFRYIRNETQCQEEINKVFQPLRQRNNAVNSAVRGIAAAIFAAMFVLVLSGILRKKF